MRYIYGLIRSQTASMRSRGLMAYSTTRRRCAVATNPPAHRSRDIDPTTRARTPLPRGDLTGQVAIVTGGAEARGA